MGVTHSHYKSVPHYSLVPRGEHLSSVSSVKDLGITISHDLLWTLHVVEVVNNANKVIGLIKRTIGSVNNSELFDVISQHLPTTHSYADDTGIYLAFNPNDDSDQDAATAAMEACLRDIRSWIINQ